MANAGCTDSGPGATSRKGRGCKAVDCAVDLRELEKPYCLKKGLCPVHMKACAVRLKDGGNQLWRYCQQCGKLQPLHNFEQGARSCRYGLAKRRQLNASKHQELIDARQHQWPQDDTHEQLVSTQSSAPTAAWSGLSTANPSSSNLGWSVDCTVSEQESIGRTGSSNTACSFFAPLAAAAAASAASSPAVPQQQGASVVNSHLQQPALLQVLGSTAGSAQGIPVMLQPQHFHLLQQLAASAADAAAAPCAATLQHQHQQLLHRLASGAFAAATVPSTSAHELSLAMYDQQQLQPLADGAAAPAARTLLAQQQHQKHAQFFSAAGPLLLPTTAADGAASVAAPTNRSWSYTPTLPAGYQPPHTPRCSQLGHFSIPHIPAHMSGTGSPDFARLTRQDSTPAAAAAAGMAGFAGLSAQRSITAPAPGGVAGLAVPSGPSSAAARAAAAAAAAAGPAGLAGLSDQGCDAGAGLTSPAGVAGPSGFSSPAGLAGLSEADLDALIDKELRSAGLQGDGSAAAAAAAAKAPVPAPLTAPQFSSGDLDNLVEGVFGDVGFAAAPGAAGFAVLDESELDAIMEQEMMAAGVLAPAGGATSSYVPSSAPSSSAAAQYAQLASAVTAAQGAAMAAPLPKQAAAIAAMAPPAHAAIAAPAMPGPAALPVPAVAAQPPAVPAAAVPSALAVPTAAPAAAAAAGSAMMPAASAALLHAVQHGKLDALISGLFGLTAALQQMQQAHALQQMQQLQQAHTQQQMQQLQPAHTQQQMQQQPQGMMHGQVQSGMQSYGSGVNTWFHDSL